MPLKFCANLSFMFQNETSNILERYDMAKDFGFRGVEVAFPYDIDIEKIVEVKERCKMKQILLNAFPGEIRKLYPHAKNNVIEFDSFHHLDLYIVFYK